MGLFGVAAIYAAAVAALAWWLPQGPVALTLALFTALLIAGAVTASFCGGGFLAHFNAQGRCAASDPPRDVFLSFAIAAAGLSLIGFGAGRLMREIGR